MESAFENTIINDRFMINNLSYIGKKCFYNSSIRAIVINSNQNISKIGEQAFANSTISSISIPLSIEKIGISAFENCQNLQQIIQTNAITYYMYYSSTLLPNIRKFGAFSFNNCTLIKSIDIGLSNEVEYIGPGAFSNIISLTQVSIGLTYNDVLINETFYESGLSHYIISPNNRYYSSDSYCVYNKNFSILLWSTPQISELKLKEETVVINEYAFYKRQFLSRIIFSQENSLEIIGNCAFSFTGISSLDYLHHLKSIGDQAFYSCDQLCNVVFPSCIEYIGNISFSKTSISNISIPDKCEFIGDEAFSSNLYLVNATFEPNSKIQKFSKGLFNSCEKLQIVSLPKNLLFIGDETFQKCKNLKNVVIPSTCKAIRQRTFDHSIITEIIFSENSSLEIIGKAAFYQCTIMNSIQIPAKCKYFEFQSFCSSNVPSIIFDRNSELLSIGDQSFFLSNLTNIIIPSSCNFIGSRAFSAYNLTTIDFEQNSQVQSIENSAFFNSNLEKINIPSSCKYIGAYAFNYCNQLTDVIFERNSNISYIDSTAFNICIKLEIFMIPDSFNLISDILNNITKTIKKIILPGTIIDTIPSYCFVNFARLECIEANEFTYIKSTQNYAFATISNLRTVIFNCTVNLNDHSFEKCTNLMNVYIKDNQHFGSHAFNYCNSLKNVTIIIFNGTIPNYCFQQCEGLMYFNSIVSVKTVGSYSFSGCSLLDLDLSFLTTVYNNGFMRSKIINFPDNIEYIGEYAFYQCNFINPNISFSLKLSEIRQNAFTNAIGLKQVKYCGNKDFNAMWSIFSDGVVVYVSHLYPSSKFYGIAVIRSKDIITCDIPTRTFFVNIYEKGYGAAKYHTLRRR